MVIVWGDKKVLSIECDYLKHDKSDGKYLSIDGIENIKPCENIINYIDSWKSTNIGDVIIKRLIHSIDDKKIYKYHIIDNARLSSYNIDLKGYLYKMVIILTDESSVVDITRKIKINDILS